jgi:hypothetical protein
VVKAKAEPSIENIEDTSTREANAGRGNGGDRHRDGGRSPLAGIGFDVRAKDIANMLNGGQEGQGTAGVENDRPEYLP